MMASFPCAAAFWTVYEFSKIKLNNYLPLNLITIISASLAECI